MSNNNWIKGNMEILKKTIIIGYKNKIMHVIIIVITLRLFNNNNSVTNY